MNLLFHASNFQRTIPLGRPFLAALVGCFFCGSLAVRGAEGSPNKVTDQAPDGRPVVLTQSEGPLRVVYQISADEWDQGVSKGLLALKKLREQYLSEGVAPDRLQIHAVFHGKAAEHLLTDEAYNRHLGKTKGNPNTALLVELAQQGIQVELCNTRRLANGWEKGDIHETVVLVNGAYQRVIDLQKLGFAYIRF